MARRKTELIQAFVTPELKRDLTEILSKKGDSVSCFIRKHVSGFVSRNRTNVTRKEKTK